NLSVHYRVISFYRVQLQPRPELNLDRAGDSPRHDVEYAFPAAKNLRLTGHLRLEQERAVVDPGRNQDRLGVYVRATESGGTRGRLSGRTENGAGTGAGIDLGDRGNGGDRPAKSLVGMRSGLEQDLSPHFHVSNVLLGNDDLRRNRFDIVNLGDQISLLHQLVFHLLQLNGGRSHDSGDWTAHLRQLNLFLQKTSLGFGPGNICFGRGDVFRPASPEQQFESAFRLLQVILRCSRPLPGIFEILC